MKSSVLNNISVKSKLYILVSIPLFFMLVFSIIYIYESYCKKAEYDKINSIMKISSSISLLIHETQKERGMTAGFIGSNGLKFKDKIIVQRQNTNKKIEEFNKVYLSIDKSKLSKNTIETIENVLQTLSNRNNIRNKVDSLNIKLGDALSYYTSINAKFLSVIPSSILDVQDSQISREVIAYYNFLMSKERAGIQRAVGTNIFASKKLNLYNKFYSLIIVQETFMNQFLTLSDNKTKELYSSILNGKSIDEVKRMEKMLLNKDLTADATYWFEQISKKINKLKQIDDKLANHILIKSDNLHVEHNNTFILLTILLLLISIFVVASAIIIYKNISGSLKSIYDGVLSFLSYLKRESNEYDIIHLSGKDEFCKLSLLINENALNINESTELDMLCAGESVLTLNKMQNGDLSYRIASPASTPQVQTFVNIVNQTMNVQQNLFKEFLDALNHYVNYDYKTKINLDKKLIGEYKELVLGINSLRDSIVKMVQINQEQGNILNQNAAQLLENVKSLNENSTHAAASLEETSAAVTEITNNIKVSNESVNKMSIYSNDLIKVSNSGESLAKKTAESMDEINSEVSAINDAITVIDQIAFQTNILSLNAAVEAATAGEAGKGFAVVAQEVRNLASRSAEAAKEIKELVESATNKAKVGKDISTNMIDGYSELSQKINDTIELINEVNSSSKEQEVRIVQINEAINSLDAKTQENANIASQTNLAAIKMKEISEEIEKEVSKKSF